MRLPLLLALAPLLGACLAPAPPPSTTPSRLPPEQSLPADAQALPADPPLPAPTPLAADPPAETPPAPPAVPVVSELPLEGLEASVLVVPPGTARRPLLVAVHGAWDRAEWHCDLWRSWIGERAFVLCPRGRKAGAATADPSAQLYYYPTHFYIERELAAAFAALTAVHGERVDLERVVYVGFSQGAIMGKLVVARQPARFWRAVMIEGSYGLGQWEPVVGQMFHRGGGERVLFACGGWYCAGQARDSALAVQRAGGQARVVQGAGGHTYGGEVGEAVRAAFDWVVEGDERWRR